MTLFPKTERLHQFNVVPIVTMDSGKIGLSDLNQLVRTELARVTAMVIVISEECN